MSTVLRSGEHEQPSFDEEQYFAWLENHVRDKGALLELQESLLSNNPILFQIISEACAELAPLDPQSHATYFGSLLMMATEMEIKTVTVD